jgi:hypothetical protein
MRILLACEESQAVTKEFRNMGIEAYSCDILNQSGGHPEWHIKGNVLEVINGGWDCMIAFPPCTDLAMSGAKHFEQKRKDGRQQKSIEFFMTLVNAPIQFIAIENPIGVMSSFYRKPDQIINPFDFNDPARKPTCLWLKNLPKLKSINFGEAPLFGETLNKGEFHTTKGGKTLPKWYNLPPSQDRAKIRSKTFPGIAKAMATQWGNYLNNLNND